MVLFNPKSFIKFTQSDSFVVYCIITFSNNIIQILTASSAMVKATTPEVAPETFYFPEAHGLKQSVFVL